jgi:glycosyltransferase involved in cell wall biosynthesis
MKILQAHNFYQLSGGEDTVVKNEEELLNKNGHSVIPYRRNNEELKNLSPAKSWHVFRSMVWSKSTYREVRALLEKHQPDICHVHNFLPLISPSIYTACKEAGVPVVQTLHNYRLICSNGLFLREGKVCEDCLGKSPFTAVSKKCYRNSYAQTLAVANMLHQNNKRDTWNSEVDAFLCFTEFAREKFIQHGIDPALLFVKPNFVSPSPLEAPNEAPYYLYVGRLDEYKGVRLLKEIAPQLPFPLKVIGTGELEKELAGSLNLELLQHQEHSSTLRYIKGAKALLFPSLCYEGMPMTILEAFANKTPVIASNMGAMKSMVETEKTGLLFDTGSAKALLNAIRLLESKAGLENDLRENAFRLYEKKYSEEASYQRLMEIYQQVSNR